MEKVRDVLWAPVREAGLEHCRVRESVSGVEAEGLVIGVSADAVFRARYAISCDQSWRVRDLRLKVEGGDTLALDVDDTGQWSGNGRAIAALAGCIDVDLSVSPFTNTLPVRRLALQPLESRELSVAYVEVPSLRIGVAKQRYTCLVRREDGTMHRYESGSFRADVTFDVDGLVIEYPRAFTRVWPR
jgi:hypothetical protein